LNFDRLDLLKKKLIENIKIASKFRFLAPKKQFFCFKKSLIFKIADFH
jgi:hypothetical protein